jgi:hypothetical protein
MTRYSTKFLEKKEQEDNIIECSRDALKIIESLPELIEKYTKEDIKKIEKLGALKNQIQNFTKCTDDEIENKIKEYAKQKTSKENLEENSEEIQVPEIFSIIGAAGIASVASVFIFKTVVPAITNYFEKN